MEAKIRERVNAQAQKTTEAQQQAQQLQAQLTDATQRATTADTLAAQVQQLTAERDQAMGAHQRFQAAAQLGVTDAATIAGLEFFHQQAQAGVEEAQRVDFAGQLQQWHQQATADPAQLPPMLQAVFRAQQQPGPPAAHQAPAGYPRQPGTAPYAPAAPAPPQQPGTQPGQFAAPAPPVNPFAPQSQSTNPFQAPPPPPGLPSTTGGMQPGNPAMPGPGMEDIRGVRNLEPAERKAALQQMAGDLKAKYGQG